MGRQSLIRYKFQHPNLIYKKCPKCQQYLPIHHFSHHKNRPDKKDAYCKECYKQHYKETREYRIAKIIINNHKRKGYKIQITPNQIMQLRQKYANTPCPICGKIMKTTTYQPSTRTSPQELKDIISIDIKNPTNKIMSPETVWIICNECNLLKADKTPQECIEAAELLYKIGTILST
ncbi:MAG: hypothetical protein AB7D08_03515 [Bacteroidales bacterium]|jgi:5-methylcytosine-specific restriction endonuclease McrA